MTQLPRVGYDKRNRVAYITLNRPEVLNAMDAALHEQLAAVWDDFERDDELWVAVLTGAGEKAFSVGQDLKELVEQRGRGLPASSIGSHGAPGFPRLTQRFNLWKPVVARVNGFALGGGFELALACDIIVAAEHATFALPEPRLGLVAGAGGLFRLTRQAPFKAAMGYAMSGRQMTAQRAFELGLVNEVAPAEELDSCVSRWVNDISSCAPLAVRAVKEVALRSANLPLEEAFAMRYESEERRRSSADALEGPLAFTQKRSPVWSGR